jgi:hypothetical protein
MFRVEHTEQYGRGIYANRLILKDTLIDASELLVCNKKDTQLVRQTLLYYYVYALNDEKDAVVLSPFSLINHSLDSNVLYKVVDLGNRKVMHFIATRDIQVDEQLFINYYDDYEQLNIDEYLQFKYDEDA